MDTYFLFLDESSPNTNWRYFCYGGCAIEESAYIKHVIPYIENLKVQLFGNTSVILHEVDIRNNKPPFSCMSSPSTRSTFWQGIQDLFAQPYITVFGSPIQVDEHNRLYGSPHATGVDFITLHIILENFVHYLERVNGRGNVYIESRNPTADRRLQHHFYTLLANGTLFITKDSLQKHLGTINFLLKTDNNIGLQLADFVPNPLIRDCSPTLNQKNPNIMSSIKSNTYDGLVSLPQRFGVKVIP